MENIQKQMVFFVLPPEANTQRPLLTCRRSFLNKALEIKPRISLHIFACVSNQIFRMVQSHLSVMTLEVDH